MEDLDPTDKVRPQRKKRAVFIAGGVLAVACLGAALVVGLGGTPSAPVAQKGTSPTTSEPSISTSASHSSTPKPLASSSPSKKPVTSPKTSSSAAPVASTSTGSEAVPVVPAPVAAPPVAGGAPNGQPPSAPKPVAPTPAKPAPVPVAPKPAPPVVPPVVGPPPRTQGLNQTLATINARRAAQGLAPFGPVTAACSWLTYAEGTRLDIDQHPGVIMNPDAHLGAYFAKGPVADRIDVYQC